MAKIDLKNVSVEFPVYNVNARSFKKQFLRLATGGSVVEDANERSHVVVNALKSISFSLKDGDRIGLIGHNGSGKSTLLRLLAKIYEPSEGNLKIEGKISPLFNISYGIESEFTGKENISIRGTILGLTPEQIRGRVTEIADFSGLGDYLSMPIRTYSSGMFVRLAFAISTSIKPDILLIDEVFGAGDADFMKRARQKMVSLLEQSSIVVLATHSDVLIKEFCNKALLLEGGRIKYFGDVNEALALYHQKGK
ncbi:ABC transporter ATP-binding protein [Aquicella lusitana]|uniref:ABC-2 type transport system ATP-binding protein/lipopolysaccharide transport system ATP-binding protein n=1 Tax=Aquicella lusitana TaxID=254246 RepID=A0A370GZN0_9COXI|nr:ABC transporter ATP-binding protein [Aquicella lusitana]RDI48124.1 ABC-2 type transport system ATP-binding protein/lipopolysaccharide transport system ATP-binding protein [Aquicella lusitana]VVC72860.1 Teichoic acids export ATP-binding protein TagH [Aquicella lusitana]